MGQFAAVSEVVTPCVSISTLGMLLPVWITSWWRQQSTNRNWNWNWIAFHTTSKINIFEIQIPIIIRVSFSALENWYFSKYNDQNYSNLLSVQLIYSTNSQLLNLIGSSTYLKIILFKRSSSWRLGTTWGSHCVKRVISNLSSLLSSILNIKKSVVFVF